MKIEKMTVSHLEQVAELEKKCFVHPWSINSLKTELENDNSIFLVYLCNENVVGYIGMNYVLDEGYIYNVAVHENYRKKGIGSALIGELITFGKKNNFSFLTLEVRSSNEKAISLYSKFGFIKVGERKNYYKEPTENALLMTKYFNVF